MIAAKCILLHECCVRVLVHTAMSDSIVERELIHVFIVDVLVENLRGL